MPRNYDKDTVYCTSWSGDDESDQQALQMFLDDARDSNMLRMPGVFQKTIIKRYYKLVREGRILPEGMNLQMYLGGMTPLVASQATHSVNSHSSPQLPHPQPVQYSQPVQPVTSLEDLAPVVELNTDGDDNADFFLNQDDDE